MNKPLKYIILSILLSMFTQNRLAARSDSLHFAMNNTYQSVGALGLSIDNNFYSDEDKVKALFSWIINNIEFDTKAFTSGLVLPNYTRYVLLNQSAVHEGFANLFDSACNIMSIPSFVVKGYVRENFSEGSTNHCWNAVKIGGEWKYIDLICGGGRLERKEKFGVIKSTINKVSLKEKLVWEPELNENYFLADPEFMMQHHLPADPIWQQNDNLLQMDCFIEPHERCKGYFSYFNFEDSLSLFEKQDDVKQTLNAGLRAYYYNRVNRNELGEAYVYVADQYFKRLGFINISSTEILKREIKRSLKYYDLGDWYLKKARDVHNSLYRQDVKDFKSNYKRVDRSLRTYERITDKLLDNNKKYLDRLKANTRKLKEIVEINDEMINKANNDIKMLETVRSKNIPVDDDSLQIVMSWNKVNKILEDLWNDKDTIANALDNIFEQEMEAIKMIRMQFPDVLYNVDTTLYSARSTLKENSINTLFYPENFIVGYEDEYTALTTMLGNIENTIKYKMRDNHQFIKRKYREMEGHVKDAKRELVMIKKLNPIDEGEEQRFESLSQMLMGRYGDYTQRILLEMNFYESDREAVRAENKLLRAHLKDIKETRQYLSAYYLFHIAEMKNRYTNQKRARSIELKRVRRQISSCEKRLSQKEKGK